MGLITKLFRRSGAAEKEAQPHEPSDKEAARQFSDGIEELVRGKPVSERASEALKLVVIIAAYECLKATENYIKAEDDIDRSSKTFLVHCEFFYFLTHLANRRFYIDHGETIGKRWQNELLPALVIEFLETVIGHWPCEVKARIRSEMYDKINEAELDYTPCRGLLPEDNKVFTGNSLFSKLARNVAEFAGTTNPIEQWSIMHGAFEVFLRLSFQERINQAARQLSARPVAA